MSNRTEANFRQATKDLIAKNVSYRCSHPGCGKDTLGPTSDPTKFTNIGEAAHIRSAMPGGKRYVADMTNEERRKHENGIWLCRNHHKIVDSDEIIYSIEELEEWKEKATLKALNRIHHKSNNTINLIDYLVALEQLNLFLPLSLAAKLKPNDWRVEKEKLYNDNAYRSYSIIDTHTGPHLQLSEEIISTYTPQAYKESFPKTRECLIKIIRKIDVTNDSEFQLLNKLLNSAPRIKYIISNDLLVKPMLYSFNSPLATTKIILINFFMAVEQYEINDLEQMRNCFKQAIALSKTDTRFKNFSGFYNQWAKFELQQNNVTKAENILIKLIQEFPQRKNRNAFFTLCLIYGKEEKIGKVFELIEKHNYHLEFDTQEFWIRLTKEVKFLLNQNERENAVALQGVFTDISKEYRIKGEEQLSTLIMSKLSEHLNQNYFLVRSSIYSNIAKGEMEKASDILTNFKQSDVNEDFKHALSIDFQIAQNNLGLAESSLRNFISQLTEPSDILYRKLYKVLYDQDKYEEVIHLKKEYQPKGYTLYPLIAYSYFKQRNYKNAYNLYQTFFHKNDGKSSTFQEKHISPFVTCLIINNETPQARLFISKLINQSRLNELSDSFLSFLFQQQLRLTINTNQFDTILNSALEYARNDKQKAIVMSNFAKNISYENLSNSNNNNYAAIYYFKKSLQYSYDEIVILELALSYCKVGDAIKAKEAIKEIDDEIHQSKLIKIRKMIENIEKHGSMYDVEKTLQEDEIDFLNTIKSTKLKFKKNNIDKIDDLIKKYPNNSRLINAKLNYLWNHNRIESCETLVEEIIKSEKINKKTSKSLYSFSNRYLNRIITILNRINNFNTKNLHALRKRYTKITTWIDKASNSTFFDTDWKILEITTNYLSGDFKKSQNQFNYYFKFYPNEEQSKIKDRIKIKRKVIKRFLWPTEKGNSVGINQYYRYQKYAHSIIGNIAHSYPVQLPRYILETILLDKKIKQLTENDLFERIKLSLSYYHYKGQKYKDSYKYAKDVYMHFYNDEKFIGSFLRTISILKKNKEGIDVCQKILRNVESSLTYRFLANFEKEVKRYSNAHENYKKALDLTSDRDEKVMINNNIILLFNEVMVDKSTQIPKTTIEQEGAMRLNNIMTINPTYKYLSKTSNHYFRLLNKYVQPILIDEEE